MYFYTDPYSLCLILFKGVFLCHYPRSLEAAKVSQPLDKQPINVLKNQLRGWIVQITLVTFYCIRMVEKVRQAAFEEKFCMISLPRVDYLITRCHSPLPVWLVVADG